MPLNDRFFLKNFKGLNNIGYSRADNSVGENLGFDKFLKLGFKLSHL